MLKRSAAVKINLFLMAALIWTLTAAGQSNSFSLPLKARQLTGMKVEDTDGQNIGTLRNLVVDLNTGKLRYAVIGSGGFLGVRATSKLAPSQVMSAATAKRHTLSINATTAQWEHAPVFKASILTSLSEPTRAREISRYFEKGPGGVSSQAHSALSTTGRDTGQSNAPTAALKFASDVIGMRVVNQKQEKIGEVLDLLVSFGEPRPAFAIISTGKLLHRDHQYAVPLSALSRSDKDKKLTLNADAATLQQSPPFNQQVWDSRGSAASGQIYRYSTED
jgi:sporulation protein YlmC with PRC-barrel domain